MYVITLNKHAQTFFLAHIPIANIVSPRCVPHFSVPVSLASLPKAEVHVAIGIIPPAYTLRLTPDPIPSVLEAEFTVLQSIAERAKTVSGRKRNMTLESINYSKCKYYHLTADLA
jgi:hypothetical protein